LRSLFGWGRIGSDNGTLHRPGSVRWLLLLAWLVASLGYFGPWIAHRTAALTLGGTDMGEFVKFLPGALSGTLTFHRQLFYAPPFALVVSVALLAGSARLGYARPARLLMVALAVLVSLQLLPPAWSAASLGAPEFRLQVVGLLSCWILLAATGLLARVPFQLSAALVAVLALSAAALSAWQFSLVKPSIDQVYGQPQVIGWGFFVCVAGLAATAVLVMALALAVKRDG
jgi:hypothetical protein